MSEIRLKLLILRRKDVDMVLKAMTWILNPLLFGYNLYGFIGKILTKRSYQIQKFSIYSVHAYILVY